MKFSNRENVKYETTCGNVVWHSRNAAVCVCVLRANPNDESVIQFLAVKRGKDVTHSGKYCMPCGYLDWDETLEDAAIREVFEEANVVLDKSSLDFHDLDSNPGKDFQNVTAHYVACYLDREETDLVPKNLGEVEEIVWVNAEDISNYEWAFDHNKRIQTLIKS